LTLVHRFGTEAFLYLTFREVDSPGYPPDLLPGSGGGVEEILPVDVLGDTELIRDYFGVLVQLLYLRLISEPDLAEARDEAVFDR
jgi:hypothetical protein